MVEIIPYAEDDDDSSTWVPLSAPLANSSTRRLDIPSSVSGNSAVNTEKDVGSDSKPARDDETRNQNTMTLTPTQTNEGDQQSSEWQDLSSHSLTGASISQALQTSNTESSQMSWEKQLIAHLTSAATTATSRSAAVKEDDYSSEDDEKIVWKRANELSDVDKLLFKRNEVCTTCPLLDSGEGEHDDTRKSKLQMSRVSSCGMDQKTQTHQRRGMSSQSASQQTYQSRGRPSNDNNRHVYRQAAKNKLQQSLIYDPMRALPFFFLRNLYNEGKHELLVVWNVYLAANGGNPIVSPLTFFIFVALLGVAIIASGAFGFGSAVFTVLVHVGVTFLKFTLWSIWRMTSHLAWVAVWASLLLAILTCMLMIKSRKAVTIKDLPSKESGSQGTPTLKNILPWIVVLTSPSVLEFVAIFYSVQALTGPINNLSRDNLQAANECDASSFWVTSSFLLASSITAFLLILVTCCGIAIFVRHMESEGISCADDVASSRRTGVKSLEQHLHKSFAHIKCHLNACHMLSVVILALFAVVFATLHALYLYYGGSVKTFISGLGTIGFYLLYIVVGVVLLIWTVNSAITELIVDPSEDSTDQCRGLCQRISRNALKKSIIEISTNAVWSDSCGTSGLTGVLSEEDGTLRLAILEWLIDIWTLSSETTQSTNMPTTSPTEQDHSFFSTNVRHRWEESSQVQSDNVDNTSVHRSLPSYVTLQEVISKLDADEALIPAIQSYRTWVYSLPPSRNVAIMVALSKMCPAILALLIFMVWSAQMRAKEYLWTLTHFGLLSEQCQHSSRISSNHVTCRIAVMLAPLIFLEYLRVRRWWARVACSISDGPNYNQTETAPDSLAVMIGYDFDESSHSSPAEKPAPSQGTHLILRTWYILLESIGMLESSIPVVRCATVACAAADLTSDASCLVDLAAEIKNRGLLFGIGMLIIDAFNHHLYQEIRRRQAENEGDRAPDAFECDIGGKYTGAAIKAAENAAKLAHNVNCLINDKKSDPESTPGMKQGASEQPRSSRTKVEPAGEIRKEDDTAEKSSESLVFCCDADSVAHYPDDEMCDRKHVEETVDEGIDLDKERDEVQDRPSADTIETTAYAIKQCNRNEDDGGMPLWIGGGLAVVGAVVGGLAVAANIKKDDSKERTRSSQGS
ncbi:hypothetical protein HJC23_002870 [Cyclotella cryptica]|uniref:Transmembrane protein n=1 Tax=Cyclotella cryptica TaxID=29204 RepID=A0ABD3PLS1_9STRA|eukprot:CCRYP_013819-RA/>CCRYP_013819-RA protein AED:0.14 eAED:0.14 QI:0/-1/0/1/-1/1/1/0/1142